MELKIYHTIKNKAMYSYEHMAVLYEVQKISCEMNIKMHNIKTFF